jgi:hypothetical protein
VNVDTLGLYGRARRPRKIPAMETNLHSHIIGIHIQERIAFAERERLAREARAASTPERRRLLRLWRPKVAAPA